MPDSTEWRPVRMLAFVVLVAGLAIVLVVGVLGVLLVAHDLRGAQGEGTTQRRRIEDRLDRIEAGVDRLVRRYVDPPPVPAEPTSPRQED
jgi:hypothetical protein